MPALVHELFAAGTFHHPSTVTFALGDFVSRETRAARLVLLALTAQVMISQAIISVK